MYGTRTDYEPNYCDWYTEQTPEEFIKGVYYSLEHWIAVHDDPIAWASDYLSVYSDNGLSFLKECPVLDNNYYRFDIKAHYMEQWCKENYHSFGRCARCGDVDEFYCSRGCDNECFCDAQYNDVECTCPESTMDDITPDELHDYLDDVYGSEIPDFATNDSDSVVFDILSTDGFDAYYDGVHPVILDIKETVRDAMNRICNAESAQDQLIAALAVTHLEHHNGIILRDYDRGMDFKDVDQINNEGLESLIDQELLDEFIDDDSPVSFDDYYITYGRSLEVD